MKVKSPKTLRKWRMAAIGKTNISMIPKTLHYCWLGPHPKSETFQSCLESWKYHCPDFEIKEWTQANSAHYQNKFFHDALRKQQYAFAADCLRVQILYEMGGVYLDTDMLVVQPLDRLLDYRFFTGYETENRPAYGLFGAEPGNHIIAQMKHFYDTNYFNAFSPPVITHTFKELVTESNLGNQEIILPMPCFYPQPYQERGTPFEPFVTPETLAVHLWDHSWKRTKKDGTWQLIRNLNHVWIDYLFYRYPKSYLVRYGREFSRKLYHRLILRQA